MIRLKFLTPRELKESRVCFELKLPAPFYWFLYGVLALLIVGAVYAWLGQMEEIVRSPAVLHTTQNTSVVKTEITGVVQETFFQHGERIEAGDILWTTERNELLSGLEYAEHELERLEERLQNVRDVSRMLSENQEYVGSPEARRKAELIRLEQERLRLEAEQARKELEREQALPPNARVQTRLQNLEMEFRLAQSRYLTYELQELQRLAEEEDRLETQRDQNRQQLLEMREQLDSTEVKAPISGWVDDIARVNSGDLIVSGQTIVRIIPSTAEDVRVEITVATNDIARLEPGMTFRMVFPGLSPAEYGYARGQIIHVPRDARPVSESEMVFVVEGQLSQNYLENNRGERIWLSAGMRADARIIVRVSPVWRFLLKKMDFIQ